MEFIPPTPSSHLLISHEILSLFQLSQESLYLPHPPTPLAWFQSRIWSFSASGQTQPPLGRVPDSAINKNTNPVSLYLLSIKVCCSVTKVRLTLCNPMDCSTPGFPVLHHLPELLKLMSIESVMPSNHLILCYPFSCPQFFPASGSFPMSWLFITGGQRTSASASVFPRNIQG